MREKWKKINTQTRKKHILCTDRTLIAVSKNQNVFMRLLDIHTRPGEFLAPECLSCRVVSANKE